MKKLIILLASTFAFSTAYAYPMNIACQADVEYSPNGGGEQLVVNAINAAHQQILVQAYNFTSPAILQALYDAKTKRGVDVRLILDKSNEQVRYQQLIQPFIAAKVPVYTDYSVAIAHNKVMIIDNSTVITGSFNFTVSAQRRNAENVEAFYNCPVMAAPYVQNWSNRLVVSRVWTPKAQSAAQSEE